VRIFAAVAKYVFDTTLARSKLMGRIKSRNTLPELLLRRALWQYGYRYRLHVKGLPGSPDIVFRKYGLCIFIDGAFWHGYNWELKKTTIKKNRDFWIPKIEANMARDTRNNEQLRAAGYTVLRFWDTELKKEPMKYVRIVVAAIRSNAL